MKNIEPEDQRDQYSSCMYDDLASNQLRTGDIVELVFSDFEKIVRHNSLLSLFKDFEDNLDYPKNLWAILNKNCDMVHMPEQKRHFTGNLFIVPLQGLRIALKKGALKDILYSEEEQSINKILIKSYQEYLANKVKKETLRQEGESDRDYGTRIEGIVKPAICKMKKIITKDIQSSNNLQDILTSLKDFVREEPPIYLSIVEFEDSQSWKKSLRNFEDKQKEIQEKNSKIILKSGAEDRLSKLTLNQLDSEGIFFYEPSLEIFDKENDLSYLIQIEDMITLKTKEDMHKSGDLVKLLLNKRVATLTRNFSDRLLNITGNYFSKIGTPDVMADKVLSLYTKIYSNDFFLGIKEYNQNNREPVI